MDAGTSESALLFDVSFLETNTETRRQQNVFCGSNGETQTKVFRELWFATVMPFKSTIMIIIVIFKPWFLRTLTLHLHTKKVHFLIILNIFSNFYSLLFLLLVLLVFIEVQCKFIQHHSPAHQLRIHVSQYVGKNIETWYQTQGQFTVRWGQTEKKGKKKNIVCLTAK